MSFSPPDLPMLSIKRNNVLAAGRPFRLKGVNTACLEWSSDGEGHLLKTLEVAAKDWKVNIVRLPLSQDRWFGKAPEQKDGGHSYRQLVRDAVEHNRKNHVYTMLDLHWNNCGTWGQYIGQHKMPDMLTLEFWKDCVKFYKNDTAVLFDLYNEPHDVSWDVWLNGGKVEEKEGVGVRQGPFIPVTYKTPGMQKLLDAIRAAGAKNLVVAGGLDWSYDLSGFVNGYALKDPKGNGVLYACHDYPFKGDTIEAFLMKLDAAIPKIPIIIAEFGNEGQGEAARSPDPWVVRTMAEIDKRGLHYTAWDMHPGAGPCLITGWDYKPTPSFGAVVKKALKAK